MFATSLRCTACGKHANISQAPLMCDSCGGLLATEYDTERMKDELRKKGVASGPRSLWRYLGFLPVEGEHIVTLGEGNTPLVRSGNLARRIGVRKLDFKLEFLNPTGSFKDRGTAVYVSVLKAGGVERAFDDSSGNAGSSLAAYCARAGIACSVYAPRDASPQKLVQTEMYGAKVVRVAGPRSAAHKAALGAWRKRKGTYASHMLSPFFLEGTKTMAFEVAEQNGWDVPDHVVFPVGGGSLFLGAFNGFAQTREMKWTKRIPRLHCIQANACKPIVNAFRHRRSEITAAVESATVAAGIRISNPPWGRFVLEALKKTGGFAEAVNDAEILEAQRTLAKQEGLFAEPTSCAAVAGLKKLVENGEIRPDDSVVVPLTGSGLKQVGAG
jgi:threonine synthase